LADSEGWLRSLLRNTADVVTVLPADNTVLYDSPAIERVLGYAPGERVGEKGLDYAADQGRHGPHKRVHVGQLPRGARR
jgi:PAS domain S-box-containing protein